ncbi:MAG: DUF4956 domain-containing protein [Muribaculaceae bacterium]|nr:DUF4956 domain-containing protein [Muribaculaceae bacterium]
MENIQIYNVPLLNLQGTAQLIFRFLFNAFFVWLIIHVFYYRKSKKMNYYFTFSLISVSVFFLTYMLGGVKIKIGMALGLFAIFGIIRYRTEVISVREMTYLFVIITLSVINAMAVKLSYSELFTANLLFVIAVWLFEGSHRIKRVSCKYILYDRVDNIKPDQYNELLEEVKNRTGLDIINIEVGAINYLKDTVMLKVYYRLPKDEINTVDTQMKLPQNDE